MINDEYIDAATQVILVCQSRDPFFPVGGDALTLGWAETFQKSGLSPADLVIGARHAYQNAPEGFRPLPSTIIWHARTAYLEALRDLSDDSRTLMEDANHALQDMGFPPPAAHRLSRSMALGRHTDLTAAQMTELHQRLTERRTLTERAEHTTAAPVIDMFKHVDRQTV